MSAVMYHAGIDATIVVDPAAVPQYRQSGWLLASEHEANQAQAEERAAEAEAEARAAEAATKHPARSTKGEEK